MNHGILVKVGEKNKGNHIMDIVSAKRIKKLTISLMFFYSVHSCLVNNEFCTKSSNMQLYENTDG